MSEIKWIKITVDIFDNEKIKLIDTLPDRDCILVIWFKLLTLTGKKNQAGLLYMTSSIPYTDEMLHTLFNRPINSVRLAMSTFISFGMIEIDNNKIISVINWEKHQNVDGMEKIKDQNRVRKQNQRLRQKQLALGHVTSRDEAVTSRDSHATDKSKSKSKKEIRIEKENNKEVENAKSIDFSDTLPNNISKSKNEIPIVLKTTPTTIETRNSEYSDYVKALYGRIKRKSPNLIVTESMKSKGSNTFRLMVERDKRTMEFIKKAIVTVFEDDFWADNIKSPTGFRTKLNEGKFDQILRDGPKNGDKPKQAPHTKPKLWIKPKDAEPDASKEEIDGILSSLVSRFK